MKIQDAQKDLITVLYRSRKMQFNVVLENYPQDRKIAVLKVVQKVTGLGLREAKDLIESAPSTIKSAIALEEAEQIKQHLEAVGVKVSILSEEDAQKDLITVLDGFNVVLEYCPPDRKIAVVKTVRKITGLGLKEAKDLIERAPTTIKSAIALEEAEQIKQHLEAAGAKVSIK
ncbi:MAG: 50S ribosomal protein L7/L12 [Okeania sp. SIO2H7]|nr:50S ribosomal protein L7/L12 [Okeania sp. SIO2H7]